MVGDEGERGCYNNPCEVGMMAALTRWEQREREWGDLGFYKYFKIEPVQFAG